MCSEWATTYTQTHTQRSLHKIFWSTFCCTVEHVQLRNVTVAVTNISDNYSRWKCASECTKMHHFEGENTNIFSSSGNGHDGSPFPGHSHTGRGYPLLAGAHLCRCTPKVPPLEYHRHSNPPNHISGYGPDCRIQRSNITQVCWIKSALANVVSCNLDLFCCRYVMLNTSRNTPSKNKTNKAAWLVSNCMPTNSRQRYAHALSR